MRAQAQATLSDAGINRLAEIVHEVVAVERVAAATDARRRRLLAAAVDLAESETAGQPARVKARDMTLRAISAEIAAALRISDRSAQRQMSDAAGAVSDFPATLAAYEAGAITRAHLFLITELGAPLPPEARSAFERQAARRSEEESAGRLRSELALLAERMHPRTLTERHADARAQRGVRTFPIGDGMSCLQAIGDTLLIEAAADRLHHMGTAAIDARNQARERLRPARTAPLTPMSAGVDGVVRTDDRGAATPDEIVASDDRTLGQMQLDLLLDLLLSSAPDADPTRTDDGPGTLGKIRATVQVVVPATTLLGSDEHPADLVGHSPVDAATARRLADATAAARRPWTRVVTDPVTGMVLHADHRIAVPSQRLYLHARDRHCRWPGCSLPAVKTEIDHTVDHAAGGPTAIGNLACLCQRHHSMKQFTPWKVRQRGGGVLEFTSPLGRTYVDEPPAPTVRFTPDVDGAMGDPPPF